MSQDNNAIFLTEHVVERFAHPFAIRSPLYHSLKGLYSFLGVLTFSSPLNQIDNTDIRSPYNLYSELIGMH